MKKIWLVASNVYGRQVRSGSFLLLTFILPLLMIVAGAIPILRETSQDLPPVGVVDTSERLAPLHDVTTDGSSLSIKHYADDETARRAVRRGEIAGFLVVPEGYPEAGIPAFHSEEAPSAGLSEALERYVQRSLLIEAPTWKVERLITPGRVTYTDLVTGLAVIQGPALFVRVATPALLAVMYALVIYTTISQLGSAVVEEKEERSMEMIITSMRPGELVSGKVLGMGLVSLTQIGIWSTGALVAVALAVSGTIRPNDLVLPWRAIVWAPLLGIPTYFLYALLAAGLGIAAGGKAQARQLAGILGFIAMAPMWLLGILVQNPDGAFAVALTLFPLTAPIFAMVRMVVTEVPTWQLGVAFGLSLIGLGLGTYAVSRIFRASMLLYGQMLRPRQVRQALRAG